MAREPLSRPDAASVTRGESRGSPKITKQLLDASVTVFGQNGFESSRVADIARRCGVTTGAIYARWPNKRELFVAAVEHVMGHMTAGALEDARTTSPEECTALDALVSSLVSPDRDLARSLVLEAYVIARRDPLVRECVLGSLIAEVESLASFAADGKADGVVDESLSNDAVALCCQALSMGLQLVSTVLRDGHHLPTDDDWITLVARLMAAVGPPNSGADAA